MTDQLPQFTPGPWEIEDEYVQQAGKPDVGVCSVMNMDVGGDKGWYRGPITEANARLIAAAPKLYRALAALAAVAKVESDAEYRAVLDARDVIAEVLGS